MDEEFKIPVLTDNPTPEERAEFVILRLEQFIRDGRSIDEGMSFKLWQAMAKVEIANAIAEAEAKSQKDDVITKRLLFTFAAALVTVGFWGTAVSLHKVAYIAGGIVCLLAGLVLMGVAGEWRFRNWNKKRQADKRRKALGRLEDMNRRIKRLEYQLEKEEKAMKKKIKEVARIAS
ncbi:MAG TPA: hypothetical protein VGA19_09190 [Rhodospirillales bacterium]